MVANRVGPRLDMCHSVREEGGVFEAFDQL